MAPGETATLKATVLPEDSTDEVEWSSSDEAVATVKDGEVTAASEGEATITAKAGNKTATCSVTVESKMTAVDLGLSVKWAECNLGAEKPEDYGDYYAWGEVEPYYSSQDPIAWKDGKTAGYDWASYEWCNGDYEKLTKYCPADKTSYWDGEGSPDGKTVLDPEDDAAHIDIADWLIRCSRHGVDCHSERSPQGAVEEPHRHSASFLRTARYLSPETMDAVEGLTDLQAYRYLKTYDAIANIDKHYGALHTQDFRGNMEDVATYCRRMGGKL